MQLEGCAPTLKQIRLVVRTEVVGAPQAVLIQFEERKEGARHERVNEWRELEVEVLDIAGVFDNEVATARYIVAHQDRRDVVGFGGFIDSDL